MELQKKNSGHSGEIFEVLRLIINGIYFIGVGIIFIVKNMIKFLVFLSKRFSTFSQMHSPIPKAIRNLIKNTKEDRLIQYVASISEHYKRLLKTRDSVHLSIPKYENYSIIQIINQFDRDQQELKSRYNEKIDILERQNNLELSKEKLVFEDSLKEATDNLKRKGNELLKESGKRKVDINESLNRMGEQHKSEWSSPEDSYWEKYSPPKILSPPPLTRIGTLEIKGEDCSLTVPALLRIITQKSVLINASGKLKNQALKALRVIILRLLLTMPAGKVNFLLVDPVGLGSSMSGFMNLPEACVGKRIWTEPNHIERELTNASEHIGTIIQKYLRNDFPTIEDYNNQAGEIAEPYRIIVVANFPANFTESTAQRLISIARNGPQTGIYAIVMRDTDKKLPFNFKIHELERLCTIIDQEGDRFFWKENDFKNYHLSLDELPPVEKTKRLLKMVGEESLSANLVEVPFSLVFRNTKKWWSQKSDDGLTVPIGRSGAKDLQYLRMGKGTKQHGIVGGITGSGKSNLLHVIIMSLCIQYSPDEIELYLIDFKKGIEFKPYAENELPHAKVIAIQSEREFGLSVLQGLDDELQRRGDLFRNTGVQNLREFRLKSPKIVMPRIVLIVDEFQEFFTEDDFIASQSSLSLDRLARQGRALGINLLLASQTMAGAFTISRPTIEQMRIRIALQCSEAESRLILGEDNPNAELLSRPGEAYYNDENGLIEGNRLFQALFLPEKELKKDLNSLGVLNRARAPSKRKNLIVFEGNAPSDINSNKILSDLLDSQDIPELRRPILSAWLGEPISIKPHTSAHFQKQSMSNLMIIGQNEETAAAMVISSLISLAAQRSRDDVEFFMVDLTRTDTTYNDLIEKLPFIMPYKITSYKKRAINEAIDRVFEVLKEREETYDEWEGHDLFLYLIGLHRASKLKSDDGYTYPEETQKLLYILNNGADLGVHIVCWGDTIKNMERIIARNISDFGMRVVLQMSVNDSNEVIDSSAANSLGLYKAILYDEEKSGDLEKFRPYALPSGEWLESVGAKLKKRNNSMNRLSVKNKGLQPVRVKSIKSGIRRVSNERPY